MDARPTGPRPIYEVVRPPKLVFWDHALPASWYHIVQEHAKAPQHFYRIIKASSASRGPLRQASVGATYDISAPLTHGDDFVDTNDDYEVGDSSRTTNQMNVAAVVSSVNGTVSMAKADMENGFWQLPLAEARIDVLFYAKPMDALFDMRRRYGDDVFFYAKPMDKFTDMLRRFVMLSQRCNIWLNAKKSTPFKRDVMWCGYVISDDDVRNDAGRISALQELRRCQQLPNCSI
ncbi:uncharacterized protein PITG_00244 [Phytophthora infestans T30-4]|uniref:Uncharacterized protein n=1 Tax=Phytophthora infestans (strain T30-4) TaxID=403677 RepID=D0MQB0_PHYIT|nr:uncharacterized protein PITG_00244 [Phytophthora infestans T30-4]EEY57679.1 hypothetical protein PITG_00244 [Phytophthora infestans T30-4]|eukprot:XP_002908865.1 hypothetical protein PITG_00244 [Phytophthora infestans T30-4]